jgi:hypothetical protein
VFGPAHREGIAVALPADIDSPPVRRERPIFTGVGGEFVKRKTDGLRGNRIQAQHGTVQGYTGTNEIREMRELGANQFRDLNPTPFVLN